MPLNTASLRDPIKTWDKVHKRSDVQLDIPKKAWDILKYQLRQTISKGAETVLDLGCGTGNALEILASMFKTVIAVDYAPQALETCRKLCTAKKLHNVYCIEASMTDLSKVSTNVDVVFTINSLTVPKITEIRDTLSECHRLLEESKGYLMGVLPSMDSIHFQQLVLVDHNMRRGMSEAEAKKAVLKQGYQDLDFRYNQTTGLGVLQHFWTRHEIEYRLLQAHFDLLHLQKVPLSWEDVTYLKVKETMDPWDWLFVSKIGN